MNPEPQPINFSAFFTHLGQLLFIQTWDWKVAGLGLGLTALGLAWFTGKRLGVTGGFEDACSIVTKDSAFNTSPANWKLWFILGLPLGGFLANLLHWSFTLLYGQLDGITFGSTFWKVLWLLVSGFMIGFGARWAGGCTSGNTIMGVSLGSKMSILATLAFFVAGVTVTMILYKVVF